MRRLPPPMLEGIPNRARMVNRWLAGRRIARAGNHEFPRWERWVDRVPEKFWAPTNANVRHGRPRRKSCSPDYGDRPARPTIVQGRMSRAMGFRKVNPRSRLHGRPERRTV